MKTYCTRVKEVVPSLEMLLPAIRSAGLHPGDVVTLAVNSYHSTYFHHTTRCYEESLAWLLQNQHNLPDIHGRGFQDMVMAPLCREVNNHLVGAIGNDRVVRSRFPVPGIIEIQYGN